MENASTIIEDFYGVYLLYCTNVKYKGRVYIGYTVDPNRRVKQHNRGRQYGGAWKTSKKGPWVMVLIIHGFPNNISALRFEWAWQHPHTSRRLHHVSKKKSKERVYDFTIRVLSEMLQVGPWNRLPLTIRWLNEEFTCVLPKAPPIHMPICQGPVISKKIPSTIAISSEKLRFCYFCNDEVKKGMKCLSPDCDLLSHVVCLSRCFLKNSNDYVPIEGECPSCLKSFLWGDLVRKYKGCYNSEDVMIRVEAGDEFYASDSD